MNREPVNPDDPQMTAYALGELSAAEAAEFEARLQLSPTARRELASMREVMGLLSDGLRGEWLAGSERPALKLLEPLPEEEARVVVPAVFRPVRRAFAVAAAVAAMLLAGAALFTIPGRQNRGEGVVPALASVNAAAPLPSSVPHVPQLFLADEVEDPSSLNLVEGDALSPSPVDVSYLEADAVVPASYHPASQVGLPRSDANGRGGALDRVDSYLPPLGEWTRNRGATTLIERRLGRGDHGAAPSSDRVLVSGYVTMGGGEAAPRFAGGFRPVSISGNPVVNEESDLRLLADLNGLRKELSEVIGELPQDAEERAALERILERSERVVSQLKEEMAR